jgi:hypothetical protein
MKNAMNVLPSAMDYKTAKLRLQAAGFFVSEQRGFYSHFLRVRNGPPSPENETLMTLDIEDGKVAGAAVEILIWNKKTERAMNKEFPNV